MKYRDIVVLVSMWLAMTFLVAWFGGQARADRIDDARAQGPATLCEIATRLRVYGAAARVQGRPNSVRIVFPDDVRTAGDRLPMDAMYLIADENVTTQEVEFSTANMEIGWRWMDSKLAEKRHGGGWRWDVLAVEFNRQCMSGKDA